jgi:hypothetical protein
MRGGPIDLLAATRPRSPWERARVVGRFLEVREDFTFRGFAFHRGERFAEGERLYDLLRRNPKTAPHMQLIERRELR